MNMLTNCIATCGIRSIKVEAEFWPTPPSRLEVTIYRLPDLTVEVADTVTNPARQFTKTYTVSVGDKRVLCRAIP
jgi:hypothetical protein